MLVVRSEIRRLPGFRRVEPATSGRLGPARAAGSSSSALLHYAIGTMPYQANESMTNGHQVIRTRVECTQRGVAPHWRTSFRSSAWRMQMANSLAEAATSSLVESFLIMWPNLEGQSKSWPLSHHSAIREGHTGKQATVCTSLGWRPNNTYWRPRRSM